MTVNAIARMFDAISSGRLSISCTSQATWIYLRTRMHPDRRVFVTTTQIGRVLGLSQPTGSRAIKQLIDNGMLRRTPDGGLEVIEPF